MQAEEWIERQLAHRVCGALSRPHLIDQAAVSALRAVPRAAVLHAHQRRHAALNGYDQLCPWNPDQQRFERSPGQVRDNGLRQCAFGNLAVHWGFRGDFLTNWCDAAGHDYAGRHGLRAPVLQYVRRRAQRGQVVLFPVDRDYSGIGSANLPTALPDMPFTAKRDAVVWRGRFCGTLNDWSAARPQFWVDRMLFDESPLPGVDEPERLALVPRVQLVRELMGQDWADAGLVFKPREREALARRPWLQEALLPLQRPRLDLARQLACKFILAVPGNDIASGLYWALMSQSVVLLVETEWETALEAGLEPWVHYAPVQPTLESIGRTFDALRRDPARCQAMVARANAHMAPYLNAAWRDAADWATLQAYEAACWPVAGLDGAWSLSRGS